MRITFASEQVAEAAVELWQRHGFAATRTGTTVVTNGPTLWAVPVLARSIGLDQVQRMIVHDRRAATTQRSKDGPGTLARPARLERRRSDGAQPSKG